MSDTELVAGIKRIRAEMTMWSGWSDSDRVAGKLSEACDCAQRELGRRLAIKELA